MAYNRHTSDQIPWTKKWHFSWHFREYAISIRMKYLIENNYIMQSSDCRLMQLYLCGMGNAWTNIRRWECSVCLCVFRYIITVQQLASWRIRNPFSRYWHAIYLTYKTFDPREYSCLPRVNTDSYHSQCLLFSDYFPFVSKKNPSSTWAEFLL